VGDNAPNLNAIPIYRAISRLHNFTSTPLWRRR